MAGVAGPWPDMGTPRPRMFSRNREGGAPAAAGGPSWAEGSTREAARTGTGTTRTGYCEGATDACDTAGDLPKPADGGSHPVRFVGPGCVSASRYTPGVRHRDGDAPVPLHVPIPAHAAHRAHSAPSTGTERSGAFRAARGLPAAPCAPSPGDSQPNRRPTTAGRVGGLTASALPCPLPSLAHPRSTSPTVVAALLPPGRPARPAHHVTAPQRTPSGCRPPQERRRAPVARPAGRDPLRGPVTPLRSP